MENKMETTNNGLYRGFIGVHRALWGLYFLGLYWDNGKENGNYRDYRDHIGLYIGITGGI